MAPIKFEENIREKLEDRTITPSEGAWAKLSSQLEEAPKSKNRRTAWYAVAAVFIVGIIAASVFFNNRISSSEGEIELVKEDASGIENSTNSLEPSFKENNIDPTISEAMTTSQEDEKREMGSESLPKQKIENTNKVIQNSKKDRRQDEVAKSNVPQSILNKNAPLEVVTNLEPLPKTENKDVIKTDQNFNSKVKEVVAQVEALKEQQINITSEEIDALITNANREIQSERILSSKKIDPDALLLDVELELEHSFRDKVFDALGDGYKLLRTAVVERNN